MGSYNNLVRNTLLLSAGTLITKGLLFIMVPFFSRWLSTADYGTFDLIFTYVTLLIPVIDLASGEAVFRFSADDSSITNIKKHVTNGLVIVVFNSTICVLILLILYFVMGITHIIPFIILLFGELFNNYLRAFLRAIKRLDIYSLSSAITVIFIAILTTIFIQACNLGLDGIILGYGVGDILGIITIVIWTKYWKFVNVKEVSIDRCKKLILYSFPLVPNNISWWIMNVSDRLIVNVFIGPVANGIYAIANKVPAVCSSVFGMFNISWQQSAIENVDNAHRNIYFNDIFNKTISVIISLCAGLVSVNFILFDFVFDHKYSEARLYVPILITAILFSTLCQFFGGIQISLKQTKENGISTICGAIINIILNFMLIKQLGIYAVTFSTLISYVFVAVLRCLRIRKIVTFKIIKENLIFSVAYIYFIVASYFIVNAWLNLINILLATILFIFINRRFIKVIFTKIFSRIQTGKFPY